MTVDCSAVQNVSSVQCYMWDISLLFAQRRDNIELAKQIIHLQVPISSEHRPSLNALCALVCATVIVTVSVVQCCCKEWWCDVLSACERFACSQR